MGFVQSGGRPVRTYEVTRRGIEIPAQNLRRITRPAGFGECKATIFASTGQLQSRHAVQAWAVFEAVGAADIAGKSQTVQGGTAARFEIGFRPHARNIGWAQAERKQVTPKQTFVALPRNESSKDQATKVCLGFNLCANSGQFA